MTISKVISIYICKVMIIHIYKMPFHQLYILVATFNLISKMTVDDLKVNIETWEYWLHLEDRYTVLILLTFTVCYLWLLRESLDIL